MAIVDDEQFQTLQNALGNAAELVKVDRTTDSVMQRGMDADILLANHVSRDLIEASPNLKMIQTFTAGVDKIDQTAVREHDGIILCNTHVNAAEVAEYAITLLLVTAKNIIPSDRALRQGDWVFAFGGPRPNIEIRSKTCLIIGLGNIGTEIARRLRAFNAKIYAATRSGVSQHEDLVDRLVSIDRVQPLVKESDFVILSLPLTPESEGLVDSEFISWMKPTSILVNISRGSIVDEKSLYYALKEKKILGAGIDVWWRYPPRWGGKGIPPSDMPFQNLDNIVVSPHRAGYSENTQHEYLRFAGENILRFIHGETPLNIVDLSRGY
jgi:phosphoglycerate dehydrogenase-like enzyme